MSTSTLGKQLAEPKLNKRKFDPRLVPSGKVYRQLFEAQVQLTDALQNVKTKYQENPPQVKLTDKSIPLVKEIRSERGNGILTKEEAQWVNSNPNESLVQNPIYVKYQSDKEKIDPSNVLKEKEKESVFELPDTVLSSGKTSDVEARIEASRKKKHNETWEDMVQEIAIVNLNLEPEIKSVGVELLKKLSSNDKEIEEILKILNTDDITLNGSYEHFEQLRNKLIEQTEIRKSYIDEMDLSYITLENQRVESIRKIFNQYAEQLFKISFLPKPNIERLLDTEIQQLNGQIITNKTCYAQLYSKLITEDIDRERNQMDLIEAKFTEWRSHALKSEIENLETFVDNMNMLNPEREKNFEQELQNEQKNLNQIRFELIETLKILKPPESTKSAVYKWFETFRLNTIRLEHINTNYVNKLQMNFEESNQIIISNMEESLKTLIEKQIIDETNSKVILEQRLLPIWSRKQKEIEEYIQKIDTDLEEINQILNKELNSLFKYLQGACHIWDLHEIGLVKKERALQELLQDCRRDHDTENQKKEEKLDSILDQMRESSNEKDLKKLLLSVSQQLDVIKNGYFTFRDSQMELLKQYPIMVKDELDKYEEALFKFFSITKDLAQQEMTKDQNELETFRSILKEVLSTERGNKFYIMMRCSTTPEEDLVENDILNLDELIPNTKQDFLNQIRNKNYLKNSFIPLEIFKEIKHSIRMNFLNHLENWIDEANLRSNTIVAAKSAEIDKELELRIHLHEPRIKRVEMDVHNVRAAELIMHEERVERHCAGVQEAIDNMQKQFLSLQQNLIDKANQNKSAVLNLEIAFNNATKSLRLTNLQDQLNKQKDRHIDDVKTTLRNFRAKFDDTLSFLRNSNAKFRFSFNVFSDGGNFSAEEIDLYKRKLEKMALLIDNNETSMLKEMEKLEKKHLDEAIKVMTQFQEKFKYNLIDLQFIEKIGRWLNNTQIKIKSSVNESNASAKELNSLIEEFDVWIDACKHPNLDKKNVSPKNLIEFFEKINKQIYDRAVFLKCFKEETQVPLRFTKVEKLTETDAKYEEAEKEKIESPINKEEKKTSDKKSKTRKTANLVVPETPEQDQRSVITKSKSNILMTTSMLKSGSKVAISDDPALDIMKTILNKNNDSKLNEAKEYAESVDQSTTQKTVTTNTKKFSKNSRSSKLSKASIANRRAKTRDEMYAYYLTFGEHPNPDTYFIGRITNILREALEGILSNSEIYYRDLHQQNRQITRRASLKDSYPEFAEAIISKLKSYLNQCDVYRNQCLKEFRESVTKFEILSAQMPELVFSEIYVSNQSMIESDVATLRQNSLEQLARLDEERKVNDSTLRPALGHPNMQSKLDALNDVELKRQEKQSELSQTFIKQLNSKIQLYSDKFIRELAKNNESLLIKFDDILTVDEVMKHETSAEKHATAELIKRHLAGVSLEDPEPEPLIRREKGKWKGVENYDFFKNQIESKKLAASLATSINTAKTTLPHKSCSQSAAFFHQKFKKTIEKYLRDAELFEGELKSKEIKWNSYWLSSIKEIKGLYN